MAPRVLVDTCMWVEYFNRPASSVKREIDLLIDDDSVAMVGPILTEVLLGFRRREQADWVASALAGLHWIDLEWEDWRTAANLGRDLARRGHSLPLSDLMIASVALRIGLRVYSIDPHFDAVELLRRYPALP